MLKAVIFDLDDTLIDWSGLDDDYESRQAPHLSAVFEYICQQSPVGRHGRVLSDVPQTFARALDNSRLDHVAPHMGRDLLSAATELGVPADLFEAEMLMRAYQWGATAGCAAFPEAEETLTHLRDNGLKLGLVTNAYQPMWARDVELEAHGIADYFRDCRVSAADHGYLKPHPSIFQAALDCLEVEASETVFVGDDVEADIVGAQAAGIFAVLRVSKRRVQELNGTQPDSRIESLLELPFVLDKAYPGWRR